MNIKDDCIFCKIVAGEIPSVKVYEDSVVLAFMDVGPISDGHTLVIPKQHIEKLHQCDPETMAQLGQAVSKVADAVSKAIPSDGYNVLCNNGRSAGQLVDHMHFHIIPRNSGDGVFSRWPAYEYPQGKAQKLADKIREYL